MFQLNREERNFREEVDDSGKVPVFKTRIFSSPRFGERGAGRRPNKIDHPRMRGEGSDRGIHLHDDQDNHIATRSFELERLDGGSWVSVSLGRYRFRPARRRWRWGVLNAHLDDNGKFTYEVEPGEGTFRLRSRVEHVTSQVPQITLTERGSSIVRSARWGLLRCDWSDMLEHIAETHHVGNSVEWVTQPFSSTRGQVTVFDPTDTYNANLSEARASDGFDNGSVPFVGGDGSGFDTRSVVRFDITSLPAANTVSQTDVTVEIFDSSAAFASNNRLVDIRPYNGDGYASDPGSDSGSNIYTRCASATNIYVNSTSVFQATGPETFTDLGTQANTDIEAARDSGTFWSLGFHVDGAVTNVGENADFRGDGHADEPTIEVTHAAAGGGLTIPVAMNAYRQRHQSVV